MKQTLLIILLFFLLLSFCGSNNRPVPDGPGAFSYKGGHVAFTHFKNNVGSLYYTRSIDSVARPLTFPERGWDLTFELSADLSKILYVNYPESNYEVCHICLYDLASGRVDTLLKKGRLITDVCLSRDNKFVYFLNASENKNYSPVAAKAPHGTDIYELNVQTRHIRRLTDLKAYGIHALKLGFSDSILVANCYDKNGIILVSTLSGNVQALHFNSPRKEVQELFIAVDLRPDSLLYTAPYELFRHNLRTDESELLLRCPDGYQFGTIEADSTWTNILFNCGNKEYSYNIPRKKLSEIELRVK